MTLLNLRFLYYRNIFLIALLILPQAKAYELVFVHAIASSKRTFVIRLGKAHGIVAGIEGTFSSPYISLVAKALTVTREFSQWGVMEPGAYIPFEKNQIITYHGNSDGMWSHDPDAFLFLLTNSNHDDDDEKERLRDLLNKKKGQALSMFSKAEIPKSRSLSIKAFFSKGLSQSVSLANSAQITSRQGSHFAVLYENELFSKLFWGMGLRLDQELTDSPTILVTSTRIYGLVDLSYHLISSEKSPSAQLYLGSTAGLGISNTQVAQDALSGKAKIFPSFRLGTELALPKDSSLQLEVAAESISITESFSDGDQQTTNEVNIKAGIGLKKYF